jgi:hypothetical protein
MPAFFYGEYVAHIGYIKLGNANWARDARSRGFILRQIASSGLQSHRSLY